jgi:RNA polymerase sigma-70 factor (ECF subfamily)
MEASNMLGSELSERQAIFGAGHGDPDCFESLYHRHKRRVYTLCLRMTRATAEAENLTPEVFLQLFRKVATFRCESAFSTWLHRAAVNCALMHLRKKNLPIAAEPAGSQLGRRARPDCSAAFRQPVAFGLPRDLSIA